VKDHFYTLKRLIKNVKELVRETDSALKDIPEDDYRGSPKYELSEQDSCKRSNPYPSPLRKRSPSASLKYSAFKRMAGYKESIEKYEEVNAGLL
jgi:hypothetical protein